MESVGFNSILILLTAAVFMVALFRYLHLPQILAYLGVGILVGPAGFEVIPQTPETQYLAEFGLVFLMFTIGLEFSLPKMIAMRRMVFGMGGVQVLITGLLFGTAAWFAGIKLESAIIIGGIFSLSSTAVVMKLLVEQLEQTSRHGRAAFSILLFQDLAVVPLVILIPAFGGDGSQSVLLILGTVVLKSVVVLALIIYGGRWLLEPIFHEAASSRSREFFMLTVLLVTLGAAAITHTIGLSLALGSFLAGMMIGETQYRHQVESDILPFRDILLGLFFITVGMRLDPASIIELWQWIAIGVVSILVVKTALITLLGRMFGMESGSAFRTGIVLSQCGEFGFAILVLAQNYSMLSEPVSQVVLSVIIISMMLAPFIVRFNGLLAKKIVPNYMHAREHNLDVIREEAHMQWGHVIVCGFGRSGQNLVWLLKQENIQSLALDLDPVRVRDARDAGEAVVYGDSTRRDVLEAAGLARASAMAISFRDMPAALKILEVTRTMRPEMPVIVRTVDDVDIDRLIKAGATEVVPESLEGSLMIGSHMLLLMGVPVSRIVKMVRTVREDQYKMLRGFFHGEGFEDSDQPEAYHERLHTVLLTDNAYAVGRTLANLQLDRLNVGVTAIRRSGIQGPQPAPTTRLVAGDGVVVFGSPEAIEQAEKRILEG
jgi:CPA2 family monovalent cation:H+ antiporter-2